MKPSILFKKYKNVIANIIRDIPNIGTSPIFIFGSVAKGTDKEGSDLDIMIEVNKWQIDPLDILEIQDKLSEIVGCPVNLALSYRFKDNLYSKIKKEIIVI